MAAKLHIERMMHRNSIAVAGESAASYALIKLIPTALGGASKPMGLNLALVLDVSGSMYEEDGTGISRLKRIQDAAVNAIAKLSPTTLGRSWPSPIMPWCSCPPPHSRKRTRLKTPFAASTCSTSIRAER